MSPKQALRTAGPAALTRVASALWPSDGLRRGGDHSILGKDPKGAAVLEVVSSRAAGVYRCGPTPQAALAADLRVVAVTLTCQRPPPGRVLHRCCPDVAAGGSKSRNEVLEPDQ